MSEDIIIHGHPNGGVPGSKPRSPLVQILAATGYGDVASITFHPVYAESVANSILKAAKAARAGRKIKSIRIDVSDTNGDRT